jgi:hypothetical protein
MLASNLIHYNTAMTTYSSMALQPILVPGHIFQFCNTIQIRLRLLGLGISHHKVAIYKQDGTKTPVFERVKTVHALAHTATVPSCYC